MVYRWGSCCAAPSAINYHNDNNNNNNDNDTNTTNNTSNSSNNINNDNNNNKSSKINGNNTSNHNKATSNHTSNNTSWPYSPALSVPDILCCTVIRHNILYDILEHNSLWHNKFQAAGGDLLIPLPENGNAQLIA